MIFRKLPRSHAAIEEWFIVGIQFAQWAPEVADLPQWDTTCDIKNGEITTEHFRWAAASANFRRALESTAIEPSLIDELYDEFRNCRRPESEKKIQHLSNRLRYLAQTQDNQYPLSELDDATASPAVSKESSSVKSIIGAVPSLWPRADKIAVIGLLIAFMAAVGTYLAVPIEIYKAIIERLHSHVG